MTEVLDLWSPLWIGFGILVGSLFQNIALLQHHNLSLLAVLYSQLYDLLLLSDLWLPGPLVSVTVLEAVRVSTLALELYG